MKLIIILAVAVCCNTAKLDRTYLPPTYAQTSGGSGNFLQTPVGGPSQNYQTNGFQADVSGNYAGNGFSQGDETYGQNDNNYAQNNGGFAQNNDGFAQNGNGFAQNGFNNFEGRPERAQAAFERNAAILRQDNSNDVETYSFAYETENGIVAEENGVATNGVEAQGGFSYTGDDGQVYSIRYTADQNGFQPQGEHLPTPPPIPEEILKALEQNAQDEANGIFDDGTYNEAKYGGAENGQFGDSGYNYNSGNGNNFNAGGDFSNGFNDVANDDSVVTNNALIRSKDQSINQYPQSGFGNQNTQASFGDQNTQTSFGNQNSQDFGQTQAGFGNQNAQAGFNRGVEKAYLPPVSNGQRGLSRYQQNRVNQNGVEKAYVPPEQFGQRQAGGQRQGGRYNQRNGLRNGANGVEKAYLPPFGQGQAAGLQGPAYNQPQSFGNQASNGQALRGQVGRNGASREYLPPTQNQRTNGRGGGRRPSFNSRNGYQY